MKRHEALRRGMRKYESDRPCSKVESHGFQRYTTSGACVKCVQRSAALAYEKSKRRVGPRHPNLGPLPLPEHTVSRSAPIEGKYFTGLRCSKGHLAWRYASSGNCVRCHSESPRQKRIKQHALNVINAFAALGPAVVVWSGDEPPEGLPLIDRRDLGAWPVKQTPCFLRFQDVPGMLEICRALHMTPIDEYVRNL